MTSYDAPRFERLIERLRKGELAAAQPEGPFQPPGPGDVMPLPATGTPDHARCMKLGEDALRRGELGLIIVAGGAGTRFGGAVKGLVEVLDGRTFLDLKLEDARRATRPGGMVVVWSAAEAADLEQTMGTVFGRFRTEAISYAVDLQGRAETYWLYVGHC